MGWKPSLRVACNRCGKPRGLAGHACVTSSGPASRRRAALKPALSFGTCPKCRKPYGPAGQLGHTCAPKSDFGKRRAKSEREQKAKARRKRQSEKHDYQACQDADCPRPLCVAFRTGYKTGDQEGYERGYGTGYDAGFLDGIDACPRAHA